MTSYKIDGMTVDENGEGAMARAALAAVLDNINDAMDLGAKSGLVLVQREARWAIADSNDEVIVDPAAALDALDGFDGDYVDLWEELKDLEAQA